MYTREKQNLKLFEELALAYERQGSSLHPMLRRLTSHLRWIDCIRQENRCKYRSRGKCKLTTSSRKEYCPNNRPYVPSITPREQTKDDKASGLPPTASFSQQSATSARRILGNGVFSYTSGRGYYCTSCKVWMKYYYNMVIHSKTSNHKRRLALR